MLLGPSGREHKTQRESLVCFSYNTLFWRNVKEGLKVKQKKRCDSFKKETQT